MDRIIDFNELKNRVKDEDIDKFEGYMYSLYYKLMNGEISMADMSKEMASYAQNNNISNEKFVNLQTKMMERYGIDESMIKDQLKNMGIDPKNFNLSESMNSESTRKVLSFHEKYKGRINSKMVTTYAIKNDKNDIKIIIDELELIISSHSNVDLTDNELNEFLCSYKKVKDDKELKISIYNNYKEYQY